MTMEGYLVLENGIILRGALFGIHEQRCGELIFNTGMTGYQEILYDPSYRGQMVVMTYPLIGNYGMNEEDTESTRPYLEAFIVRHLSTLYSNWRATGDLDAFCRKNGIAGIEHVDTRRLTCMLRDRGALKGGIFPATDTPPGVLVEKVRSSPSLVGRDLVRDIGGDRPYWWSSEGDRTVVVIDCGVKHSILRMLAHRGLRVRVVPARMPWQEIASERPDGILVSNGPGDPAPLEYVSETVSRLMGKYPIFGICLGHQVIARALGGKTYKLKFGHHGVNHPVRDARTGRICITVQNHGFCVDAASLGRDIEVTHVNLNDGTIEGLRHRKYPLFAVQFHPEASPGPHDARYLFDLYAEMIRGKEN